MKTYEDGIREGYRDGFKDGFAEGRKEATPSHGLPSVSPAPVWRGPYYPQSGDPAWNPPKEVAPWVRSYPNTCGMGQVIVKPDPNLQSWN